MVEIQILQQQKIEKISIYFVFVYIAPFGLFVARFLSWSPNSLNGNELNLFMGQGKPNSDYWCPFKRLPHDVVHYRFKLDTLKQLFSFCGSFVIDLSKKSVWEFRSWGNPIILHMCKGARVPINKDDNIHKSKPQLSDHQTNRH